jgi:transposase|tara:strand:- start:456 stop:1538 length:1083 start_codon:yes stop_codon:yes gene_type:complete
MDKEESSMTEIMMIGIDLGKKTFQLCAVDVDGKELWNQAMSAEKARRRLGELPPALVVMEACGGAHYWAGEFAGMGHAVSLLHPRHVTPFVTGPHKSDARDARGITVAARQPDTRRIAPKPRDARELQGLLRLHHGLVRQRTASINRFRGLLREHGYRLAKGRPRGLRGFPAALEALAREAGELFIEVMGEELAALKALHERTEELKRRIGRVARDDWMCRLVMTIPGIGPLTAVALVAAIPDARVFETARSLPAWVGLVPRQNGTGGKVRLGSITKHGDGYLRRNLVQGAKSLIWATTGKAADAHPRCRLRRWILAHHATMHLNALAVAVANRMARYACAVMKRGEAYDHDPLGEWRPS